MAGRHGLGLLASALARRAQLASLCRLPHGLQVAADASITSRCLRGSLTCTDVCKWRSLRLWPTHASAAWPVRKRCCLLQSGPATASCLTRRVATKALSQAEWSLKGWNEGACLPACFCAEVTLSKAAGERARRLRCCAVPRRQRRLRAALGPLLLIPPKPVLRLPPTPPCASLRLLPRGMGLTAATAGSWPCTNLCVAAWGSRAGSVLAGTASAASYLAKLFSHAV